jgi:di/tricarboxylate transporter
MLTRINVLNWLQALPLFATSMLVPLLTVVLRVMVDHTQKTPVRLTPQQAAPAVFHAMFSQVSA